ncbi:MAG: flagellar hook assembly protein FlgD [Hyphomicrobiaceae bacterium]|nr:flagellar hook assembly protein FlgD [Hyphomicrobiaceae bacterium]
MATVTTANTATSANNSASTSSQNRLSQNYEMFLKLLTTQLQNQNPLEPMDADKFTSQLVQYSGIEQQIQMNASLEDMKSIFESQGAVSLVNYIGATVTAAGAQTQLKDGAATWKLTADSEIARATIVIKNSAGAEVYRETVDASGKEFQYAWDGKTSSGGTAPDGTYQISVTATDSAAKAVPVSTRISGVVSSVDMTESPAILKIGTIRVPVTSIETVSGS